MSSYNPILDTLERHVTHVRSEHGTVTEFKRNSAHAGRIRQEIRQAFLELVDGYETYSGDTDMLIMMLREDIGQL